jgi:phosphatidylinositol glycan class N
MFVIASLLCIFVAGLEGISELFVRGVEFGDDDVGREGRKEVVGNRNGRVQGHGKVAT